MKDIFLVEIEIDNGCRREIANAVIVADTEDDARDIIERYYFSKITHNSSISIKEVKKADRETGIIYLNNFDENI